MSVPQQAEPAALHTFVFVPSPTDDSRETVVDCRDSPGDVVSRWVCPLSRNMPVLCKEADARNAIANNGHATAAGILRVLDRLQIVDLGRFLNEIDNEV